LTLISKNMGNFSHSDSSVFGEPSSVFLRIPFGEEFLIVYLCQCRKGKLSEFFAKLLDSSGYELYLQPALAFPEAQDNFADPSSVESIITSSLRLSVTKLRLFDTQNKPKNLVTLTETFLSTDIFSADSSVSYLNSTQKLLLFTPRDDRTKSNTYLYNLPTSSFKTIDSLNLNSLLLPASQVAKFTKSSDYYIKPFSHKDLIKLDEDNEYTRSLSYGLINLIIQISLISCENTISSRNSILESQKNQLELSTQLTGDYVASLDFDDKVRPSISYPNVFRSIDAITRKTTVASHIYYDADLNSCTNEYEALLKVLDVSGIPYRESKSPSKISDSRSYLFISQSGNVFSYVRFKNGYNIKDSSSTLFLRDNSPHPMGSIITINEIAPELISSWSILRLISVDSLWPFTLIILTSVLLAGATLVPAIMVQQLISVYIPFGDYKSLSSFGLLSIGLLSLILLIQYAQARYIVRFEILSDNVLQTLSIDRLLRIQPGFIDRFSVGSLQSRVLGVSQLRQTITSNLSPIITAILAVIFNLGYLFYYSWQLACIVAISGMVLATSTAIASFSRLGYFKSLTEIDGLLVAETNDVVTGVADIRANKSSMGFVLKFSKIVRPLIVAVFNATRLNNRVDTLSSNTLSITYVFLLPAAYWLAFNGGDAITVASIIAFLTCTQTFLSNFSSAIDKFVTAYVKVQTYWDRAIEVFNLPVEPNNLITTPSVFDGTITVSGLTLGTTQSESDSNCYFKDLSFSLDSGSSLLLHGPSGCGKSTILQVLSSVRTGFKGKVLISQTDLNEMSSRIYRNHLAYVPQQLLFQQGTILHNLSPLSVPDDSVLAALLKMFGLSEFVESLPMHLGTVVTPQAQFLPDEIKKKIYLARASLKRANYVFVDDAFTGMNTDDIRTILNYFKSEGVTLVATSQDPGLSELFGQSISII
jgi:ABC-type bacteriocin/lantibiotic exporter with double-glycine peptidase domain